MNMKAIAKMAKELGLTKGAGTYNGAVYWKNDLGQIVTRDRVLELYGY